MPQRTSTPSTGTARGSERGRNAASSASTSVTTGTPSDRQQSTVARGSNTTSENPSPSANQGIVGKVREQANSRLSSQKDRALDSLGGVTQAVRQTTQQLRDNQHDVVARYVEQAVDQIERFSKNLKSKDVGELVEDAQGLARRQPALFVGSAFALGLLGARFFKSSPPPRSRSEYGHSEYGRRYDRAEHERSLSPASPSGSSPRLSDDDSAPRGSHG